MSQSYKVSYRLNGPPEAVPMLDANSAEQAAAKALKWLLDHQPQAELPLWFKVEAPGRGDACWIAREKASEYLNGQAD